MDTIEDKIDEYIKREWASYVEECGGVSEACEYIVEDCAHDLRVPEVVAGRLREFLGES